MTRFEYFSIHPTQATNVNMLGDMGVNEYPPIFESFL
jgi:hypothetical protein